MTYFTRQNKLFFFNYFIYQNNISYLKIAEKNYKLYETIRNYMRNFEKMAKKLINKDNKSYEELLNNLEKLYQEMRKDIFNTSNRK